MVGNETPNQLINFLNWLLLIFVPYAFLIGGFMMLKVGRGQPRIEKAFDIGFDSCILGFGIAAALLGGSEFQSILHVNAAIIPTVIGFVVIMVLVVLEKPKNHEVAIAAITIVVGTLIFGADTAMIAWLNERRVKPTVIWGLVSFLLPCVAFLIILFKLCVGHKRSN